MNYIPTIKILGTPGGVQYSAQALICMGCSDEDLRVQDMTTGELTPVMKAPSIPEAFAGYTEDGTVFAKFPSMHGWRIVATWYRDGGDCYYPDLVTAKPFRYDPPNQRPA
jgi:hypothetical protein